MLYRLYVLYVPLYTQYLYAAQVANCCCCSLETEKKAFNKNDIKQKKLAMHEQQKSRTKLNKNNKDARVINANLKITFCNILSGGERNIGIIKSSSFLFFMFYLHTEKQYAG